MIGILGADARMVRHSDGRSFRLYGHIRVSLVDDSPSFAACSPIFWEGDPSISIIAAVASAEEATSILDCNQVDVVRWDVEMPGVSGLHYLPSSAAARIPVILSSGAD